MTHSRTDLSRQNGTSVCPRPRRSEMDVDRGWIKTWVDRRSAAARDLIGIRSPGPAARAYVRGAMSRFPAATDFDGWVAQLANSERRQRAKIYLRQAGQPAVPAVRRGMHHPKPIVRRLCTSILDHLADEAAFVDLVAALDDEDSDVLKRALHALACDQCKENECRPGEELFVPRALELLHHPNADVRASAID